MPAQGQIRWRTPRNSLLRAWSVSEALSSHLSSSGPNAKRL